MSLARAESPSASSLDIFDNAGIDNLREKSKRLTSYLLSLLEEIKEEVPNTFTVITPKDENQRGAQLSILFNKNAREVFNELSSHNIVCDYREPNVIRIAPVPLYNNFEECYLFGEKLQKAIRKYD